MGPSNLILKINRHFSFFILSFFWIKIATTTKKFLIRGIFDPTPRALQPVWVRMCLIWLAGLVAGEWWPAGSCGRRGWQLEAPLGQHLCLGLCIPGGWPALGVSGRTACPSVHCNLPGMELHPGSCSWLVRHLQVPQCWPDTCVAGATVAVHRFACLPCGGHEAPARAFKHGQPDLLSKSSQLSGGGLEMVTCPGAWRR